VNPAGELSLSGFTSWTGDEKNLKAWLGNHLQEDALRALYGCPQGAAEKDERLTKRGGHSRRPIISITWETVCRRRVIPHALGVPILHPTTLTSTS